MSAGSLSVSCRIAREPWESWSTEPATNAHYTAKDMLRTTAHHTTSTFCELDRFAVCLLSRGLLQVETVRSLVNSSPFASGVFPVRFLEHYPVLDPTIATWLTKDSAGRKEAGANTPLTVSYNGRVSRDKCLGRVSSITRELLTDRENHRVCVRSSGGKKDTVFYHRENIRS